MKDLEKKLLVIHLLDNLLIKIKEEDGDKSISKNEEMYFEALNVLYTHDHNEGVKYSIKYNEVIDK